MGCSKYVTKSYSITPEHEAVIVQAAKDNGESSKSSGLRFILDDWARRVAQDANVNLLSSDEFTQDA